MASGITYHDVQEVQDKLAKTLGRVFLPPELWGRLWQVDYVLPVVREGYDGPEWRELVEAAREFTREKREEALGTNLPPESRDRKPGEIAGVRLDGYTRLRAETFSEVAGALANRRAEVRKFRDLYLGGTESRLTDDEAGAWIYGREAPTNALEDMREVSRRLSRAFRWRADDAHWFLLTGYVPFVRPISVRTRRNIFFDVPNYLNRDDQLEGPNFRVDTAEIVITAEPWVDAEIVSSVFREVQKQVRGGDNRKVTVKVLDAVRFVARRLGTGKVEWPVLHSAWNTAQDDPTRRYRSRDGLYKAVRRFLEPRYNNPTYPKYEPAPWQVARQAEEVRRTSSLSSNELNLASPAPPSDP
jgi:hypothetical protein